MGTKPYSPIWIAPHRGIIYKEHEKEYVLMQSTEQEGGAPCGVSKTIICFFAYSLFYILPEWVLIQVEFDPYLSQAPSVLNPISRLPTMFIEADQGRFFSARHDEFEVQLAAGNVSKTPKRMDDISGVSMFAM